MSAEDHAYVAKHHETITAWFAEAMATVVDKKPDDPVGFLRQHLGQHDELRSLELDDLRMVLEAERTERQRLEERLSKLELMRDSGQMPGQAMEPPVGELRLNLPSIAAASRELAEAGQIRE
jgi:hypothetical protein